MEIDFTLALITTAIVFILTLIFGRQVKIWFATVSSALIVLPILPIFLLGTSATLNANPEMAIAVADSTIEAIILYVSHKIPGIVISELAGAIVGSVGGAVVGMAKEF